MIQRQKSIVLVDVDHVLAHARWRDPLLQDGFTWDEYHEASEHDKLCEDIAHLIAALHKHDFQTVGITARPEKWRALTNTWLLNHGVMLDEVLHRPNDDFRPAPEVKIALVQNRFGEDFAKDVLCILDDNQEIIEAFNEFGVTGLMVFGRDYE